VRNALLILLSAAAVLALVCWWMSRQPQPPLAAGTPALTPPPETRVDERTTRRADPAAALRDIEQADRLGGANDPQRRALEIVLLVQLGRVGHARALADRFYRAFPGNPEIPKLERITGYHPRPYGPSTSNSE
jgi:hypothetical protein